MLAWVEYGASSAGLIVVIGNGVGYTTAIVANDTSLRRGIVGGH